MTVERYNLSQEPAAFAASAIVRAAMEAKGDAALPLVVVGGEVMGTGSYSVRAELAAWTGVAAPTPSLYSPAVAQLVAIGASITSNCEPCFKFHFDQARKLGVSCDDMWLAVRTAQAAKESPARSVLALAERFLRATPSPLPVIQPAQPAPASAAPAAACCGDVDAETSASAPKPRCC